MLEENRHPASIVDQQPVPSTQIIDQQEQPKVEIINPTSVIGGGAADNQQQHHAIQQETVLTANQ